MKSKRASILQIIDEIKPTIIAFTETRLTNKERVVYSGYKWCGNKSVMVHKTHTNVEAMWIRLGHEPPMFIGVYYGKQESERHLIVHSEYDTLNEEIQRIIKASHNMLLLGDFNAMITVKGYQNNSRNGQLLNHLVEDQGLMVVLFLGNKKESSR